RRHPPTASGGPRRDVPETPPGRLRCRGVLAVWRPRAGQVRLVRRTVSPRPLALRWRRCDNGPVPEPRPPDDDWQLDDVDWFDHRRRPSSQTAAGEAPPRQRSGLIPEAGRAPGDADGAVRHADIRRRRIAALAVLGG